MNWKAETDTHTVLYRKWVANQDLLYSTGNAVQYFVVVYMGIEPKKVDIRICATDSLCCTPETNTTQYTNYTPVKVENKNTVINHNGKEYRKYCIYLYVYMCVYIYVYMHTYVYMKLK